MKLYPATTATQRVYDVLCAAQELMTREELEQQAQLSREAVGNALQALRDRRLLVTVRYDDRCWRYGVRHGERPQDRRGRRQMA